MVNNDTLYIMTNFKKGFASPAIIIVIVLAVAVGVFYFSQKTQTSKITTESSENQTDIVNNSSEDVRITKTTTPIQVSSQGIIVTSIKSNDLVKLPITVEGYLDGKGWAANEGEVGNVEVFDANGKSISNKEIVKTTTDWLTFPTYFKAIVGDRQKMSYIKTDSGFVKITSNGAKDGEQVKILNIPVRFK